MAVMANRIIVVHGSMHRFTVKIPAHTAAHIVPSMQLKKLDAWVRDGEDGERGT